MRDRQFRRARRSRPRRDREARESPRDVSRHGDTNVNSRSWATWRRYAEAETRTVDDARRHRNGEHAAAQRIAAAVAAVAAIAPHFAAATALLACPPQRHFERNRGAGTGLAA